MKKELLISVNQSGIQDLKKLLFDGTDDIIIKEIINTPKSNEMAGGHTEYLQILLNAGAVVAGIQGIFSCIKIYLKGRKQESMKVKFKEFEFEITSNDLEKYEKILTKLISQDNGE